MLVLIHTKTPMSKVLPLAAGLIGGVAAAAATLALMQPSKPAGDAALANENSALKSRVEDLEKKLSALDARVQNQPAVASAPIQREAAPTNPAVANNTPQNNVAANVSQLDRDTVFALIKEERDVRDRERQDKQKQQMRDNLAQRIQQTADRIGLDAASKETLTKLYLDNLSREDEIRKAYPIKDYNSNDPNLEKRKQELEAARKDLEARVDAMIPSDKKEEWDQRTRFLRRAGDFAEAARGFQDGNFPMMGMDFGGGPGGGGFGNFGGGGRNNNGGDAAATGGGGGNNNNNGNRRGNRGGNRNNNNAGGTDAKTPPPGATDK